MMPTVTVVELTNNHYLLTTSDSINSGSYGINYGGVDDGSNVPSSRELDEFFSNWNE